MNRKGSWRLTHLPFNASPATNKGHLGTIIDICTLPESSCQHAPKTSKCDPGQRPYYQVSYCLRITVLNELLHCFTLFYTDFRINAIKDRGSGYFFAGIVSRIKSLLSYEVLAQLLHALITTRIYYCNSLFLQFVQEYNIARLENSAPGGSYFKGT